MRLELRANAATSVLRLFDFAVPKAIGLVSNLLNPALSPKPINHPRSPIAPGNTDTLAVGPKRLYLDIPQPAANLEYPPRPVPGSIADLDIVKYYCDYDRHKVCVYLRSKSSPSLIVI